MLSRNSRTIITGFDSVLHCLVSAQSEKDSDAPVQDTVPVESDFPVKMDKIPNIVKLFLFCGLIQVISASDSDMDCGVRNLAPDSGQFAISGDNMDDPKAPWTAAVGNFIYKDIFEVRCSGVVITRRHVITAAHCFKGLLEYVRVGVIFINEDGSQDRKITSYHKHPEYDNTFNYDIMILGLNEMLTFNGKVSALCLPEAPYDHPGVGKTIIVQGWG